MSIRSALNTKKVVQESIPIFVEIAEAVPCVSHAAFASL